MSLAELTRAVLGDELNMDGLIAFLDAEGEHAVPATRPVVEAEVRVGSIGYERFPLVADFARCLRDDGIERLIDVRQLPISRRRGYAKTALSLALAEQEIEYVHMKGLGNPKPLRDLYKSGRSDEGRRLYVQHLAEHGSDAVDELVEHVQARRCALMCVEHDVEICHRHVIFEALRERLDARLVVTEIT